MIYIDDCTRGISEIIEAPKQVLTKCTYNLGAISFSPKELVDEMKNQLGDFSVSFKPDFRQQIADSWPHVLDAAEAQKDWGWQHEYTLEKLVSEMIKQLGTK